MKTLNHPILGELNYYYGWVKPIKITFESKLAEIKCVFEAFEDEEITQSQIEAYQDFISHQASFEKDIPNLLQEYKKEERIKNATFVPQTLLFKQDGSFGLLCDSSWDEENGIVISLYLKQFVTVQNEFL